MASTFRRAAYRVTRYPLSEGQAHSGIRLSTGSSAVRKVVDSGKASCSMTYQWRLLPAT